jgi:hypothetical protein
MDSKLSFSFPFTAVTDKMLVFEDDALETLYHLEQPDQPLQELISKTKNTTRRKYSSTSDKPSTRIKLEIQCPGTVVRYNHILSNHTIFITKIIHHNINLNYIIIRNNFNISKNYTGFKTFFDDHGMHLLVYSFLASVSTTVLVTSQSRMAICFLINGSINIRNNYRSFRSFGKDKFEIRSEYL